MTSNHKYADPMANQKVTITPVNPVPVVRMNPRRNIIPVVISTQNGSSQRPKPTVVVRGNSSSTVAVPRKIILSPHTTVLGEALTLGRPTAKATVTAIKPIDGTMAKKLLEKSSRYRASLVPNQFDEFAPRQTFSCEACGDSFLNVSSLHQHWNRQTIFCQANAKEPKLINWCQIRKHFHITRNQPHQMILLSVPAENGSLYSAAVDTKCFALSNSNCGTNKCSECEHSCSNQTSLEVHFRTVSSVVFSPKGLCCHYRHCTKKFLNPCQLKAHERTHVHERPFICPECGRSFDNLSYPEFRQHLFYSCFHPAYEETVFSCFFPDCETRKVAQNIQVTEFQEHLKTVHMKTRRRCLLCNAMVDSDLVDAHFQEKHQLASETVRCSAVEHLSRRIIICDICEAEVDDDGSWEDHYFKHPVVFNRITVHRLFSLSTLAKHDTEKKLVAKTMLSPRLDEVSKDYSKVNLEIANYMLHRGMTVTRAPVVYVNRAGRSVKFMCMHCDSAFMTEDTVNTHLDQLFKRKAFSCRECSFKPKSVDEHSLHAHPNVSNYCRLCLKVVAHLERHLKDHHLISTRMEAYVKTQTPKKTNVSDLLERRRPPVVQAEEDSDADEESRSPDSSQHKDNDVLCQLCDCRVTFGTLQIHVRTNHLMKKKLYVCWICKEKKMFVPFNKKGRLEKHLDQRHSVNKLSDPDAFSNMPDPESFYIENIKLNESSFSSKRKLDQSSKTPLKKVKTSNDASSPFTCAYCSFETIDRAAFRWHLSQNHLNESMEQCEECGLHMKSNDAIKKHLFILHGVKDMSAYYASRYGDQHAEGSNGAQGAEEMARDMFTCKVCRKKFVNLQELNKHTRIHGLAFISVHKKSEPVHQ